MVQVDYRYTFHSPLSTFLKEKYKHGVISSVRKGGTTIILKDRINVRIPHHLLTRQRVSIDPAEAVCYISNNNNQHLNEEINAKNWRKLIEHEPIDILLKIGDNISVTILDIEPVDGYINVQSTKKIKKAKQSKEKQQKTRKTKNKKQIIINKKLSPNNYSDHLYHMVL